MSHKKLSLVLAVALISPALLGSFSTSTASAAKNAPANAAVSATWTDTTINITIHTKNLIGLPIYDQNGQIIEHQNAPANQDFATSQLHKNATTKEVFYKIGDNQYLSANEVLSGIKNIAITNYKAVIHTVNNAQIQLYDGNGNAINQVSVAGKSAWFTNQQAVNIDSGVIYYQISPNRYVSSNDISHITGTNA